jgi:U3 small nucleolar ribonucleoprotein protein LCP5
MNDLLDTINKSIHELSQSIEDNLILTEEDIVASQNGISLLSLKNQSLLSYLESLVLIIATRVQQAVSDGKDLDKVEKIFRSSVESSIVHRVTLEKGVKGLEAKINYQIDKLIRAHLKTQEQAEEATKKAELEDGEDSGDEDSDQDELSYKPHPTHLLGQRTGAVIRSSNSKRPDEPGSESDSGPKKYRIPKISAVSMTDEGRSKQRSSRQQKNALMEEYINESSELPRAEPSIGSTIVDHGRGGERTERERHKQREIQQYEEENYTRLQGLSNKQERRAARQRQRDAYGKSFFGEDWSFLGRENSDRPKRKQSSSAWERAKRRKEA